MASPQRVFADEFVPNEEASTNHKKWEQANPRGDAPKWRAYRDAVIAYKKGDSVSIPTMATPHGRALVAAGKQHMSVTDLGSVWTPPSSQTGVLTGVHWGEVADIPTLATAGYDFTVNTFQPGDDAGGEAEQLLNAALANGMQMIIGMYPEPYTWTGSTWTISAAGVESLNYLETRESEILALFVFNEPYNVSNYSAAQLRSLRTVIKNVWPNAKIYHDMGRCSFWPPVDSAKWGDQSGTLDFSGSWYYPFKTAAVGTYPTHKAFGLSELDKEQAFIRDNIGGGARMVWLHQTHSAPVDDLVYPTDLQLDDWNKAVRARLFPTSLVAGYVWRQGIYPDYLVNHPTQWPLILAPGGSPPPGSGFPQTPILDAFNRANATTLGVSWGENIFAGCPSLRVVSNAAAQVTAFKSSYWNTSLAADQEAYCTLTGLSAVTRLMCRIQNPGGGTDSAYYIVVYSTGDAYLEKHVSGVETLLQSLAPVGTFSAGDKIGIRVDGTTISCWQDTGSGWAQMGTDQTDASVAGAGYVGVYMGNSTAGAIDDFGGGAI